jgi:WD40 repeat protein/DNA-binding SARP family transcriptional activator
MFQIAPASRLDIQLLGPPQVIRDGTRVAGFRSSKAQALLYFLAATGRLHRRTVLATLFWPEADDSQAGASLRNVLSNLRGLVGDCLGLTREAALLQGESLSVDVAQFDALLKRTGDQETDVVQMEAAVSLYRGDFLQGFHVPDAPEFEQWATIERERLREAALNCLLALADWHAAQADHLAALEDLARLLALDPTHELAHRQKMIALARLGQRSAALQQYDLCRRVLANDLGVEVSAATVAVHELILAGSLGADEPAGDPLEGETGSGGKRSDQRRDTAFDRRGMPERTRLYGREAELAAAERWLIKDEARLVVFAGLGGVGKTALAVELLERLPAAAFERVIWRSVVNAPPFEAVLDGWLQVSSDRPLETLPESAQDKLALLLEQLARRRILLVLDNLETIMEPGAGPGRFRGGYEGYGNLIELMARSRHRSCLLLTTRELPPAVRGLEEDSPRVRVLALDGLPSGPASRLLRERGVSASDAGLADLAARYSGNPLALRLVADTVRDLFASNVAAFLEEETPIFDDIRGVLDQQYERLGDAAREIVAWLAVGRKPVSAQALWRDLVQPPRRGEFLETLRALQNNSLVEAAWQDSDASGRLGLQNVVMEYVSERIVRAANEELESGRLVWLRRLALVKAQDEEYIQASQRRLLLEPVARTLLAALGREGAIERLRSLLAELRSAGQARDYAAANILHLLLRLEADLKGWDFSGLSVWQADLREVSLAGVDLSGADLRGSAFAETFGLVRCLACSLDGRYLAAGDGDGAVFVWRLVDFQPHLAARGHGQGVGALAFSPDGSVLASGGYDGKVCLWATDTGDSLARLEAHTDTIAGIAFSPDGDFVASGGADNRVIVWNWRRGEISRSLLDSGGIDGLAWSADGRWLVSAKDDHTASVWDWRRGEVVATLRGHQDKVHAVTCSRAGGMIATGGEDRRVLLWTLPEGNFVRALDAHAGWVWSVAFSPDGSTLASASADRTVRLWDVASGQLRRTLFGHTSWVAAVAYTADGGAVASGGYDQSIRVWDERSGLLMRALHGHQSRVERVNFSSEGRILASSSLHGPIQLWDAASARHLRQLTGHRGLVRAVAVSETRKLLACGSDDRRVYVWNTDSGHLLRALDGHSDMVRHVAFSPGGRYLVTGSHDRTLRVWDAESGKLVRLVEGANVRLQSTAAFSPDGALLCYGSDSGSVVILDLPSCAERTRLDTGGETPVTVAFGAFGDLLACGTREGAIRVWQRRAGAKDMLFDLRLDISPEGNSIWRVFFSPDGRQLVVCSDGGANRVIDVERGEVAYALPDAPGAFNVIFGSGGQLATAGADRAICVRDAATGEARRMLRGHQQEVTSLDFSNPDNLLASSSVDGTVRLWDMETGKCVATLEPRRLYTDMDIAGARGITPAQRATLLRLGAVER